ncbi:hypothetical protein FIBSPDRAFT_365149 [Athelia psychrophila]|uniref:Uncharacterized protein n=1 Tax=Athelia psychrophila TaxID=1759441 RepID=A0A167VK69_9AGAM|nr:hypothetical protein FIBSPDRAFT_365149 [Fibularhizoctonia sp. CBS 109695]
MESASDGASLSVVGTFGALDEKGKQLGPEYSSYSGYVVTFRVAFSQRTCISCFTATYSCSGKPWPGRCFHFFILRSARPQFAVLRGCAFDGAFPFPEAKFCASSLRCPFTQIFAVSKV